MKTEPQIKVETKILQSRYWCKTRKSPNADGTRATLPHSQSTIAQYTELDAECDQQPAIVIVVDCRPHLPRTSAVAARWRCTQWTDRCRCLSHSLNGRRPV